MKKTKVFYLVVVLAVSALLLSAVNAGTISEEARRHMIRGQAAVEAAKSSEDFKSAIAEFEQARILAPDWPEVYFNLGMVQEKVGNYDEATNNLRKYLKLLPNANDAAQVRDHIYKLEYIRERSNIEGIWKVDSNETEIECDPKSCCVTERGLIGCDTVLYLPLEILKKSGGYEARVLSSKSLINALSNSKDGPFVTLHHDGETIKKFDAIIFTCLNRLDPNNFCPWRATFILRHVSADRLEGTIKVSGLTHDFRLVEGSRYTEAVAQHDMHRVLRCNGKIVLKREK